MKKIQLHAYAKINLTLDVTGKRPNGYHDVEMIMQQISLCDEVTVSWEVGSVRRGKPGQTAEPDPTGIQIQLTVSRPDLPADSSNLAWKAAEEMIAEFGGPAGGSSKAAAGTDAAGGNQKPPRAQMRRMELKPPQTQIQRAASSPSTSRSRSRWRRDLPAAAVTVLPSFTLSTSFGN